MNILEKLKSVKNNERYLNRYYKFIKYCEIVNLGKTNLELGYTENHHICPIALFPNYKNFKKNSWNKITLTTRQHLICHWMLSKAYGGSQTVAFFMMNIQKSKGNQKNRYSIKISTILRNQFYLETSNLLKGKVSSCVDTIWIRNISTGVKRRIKNNLEIPDGWICGTGSTWNKGKSPSKETIQKHKDYAKNNPNGFEGKTHSEETKIKLRKPKNYIIPAKLVKCFNLKSKVYLFIHNELNIFEALTYQAFYKKYNDCPFYTKDRQSLKHKKWQIIELDLNKIIQKAEDYSRYV